MTTKYFNAKTGVQAGNIILDAANGSIEVDSANVTEDISVGGNATIKGNISLGTSNQGGNISNVYAITANYVKGDGSNISNITGSNVTGTVANATYASSAGSALTAGSANSATYAGTVLTNAQPNITSVGTLTSLTVAGTSNLGSQSNVVITGGSSGQVLSTDGAGNLTWVSASGVNPSNIANGTSNVSIPAANGNIYINATGTEQWVFDTTGTLTAPGNLITGSGTGGNISGLNSLTANIVTANYFSGDGSNLSNVSGTSNGTSNVSIPAANGNIYINATGTEQWVFDTTGTLTAPGNLITGSGTGGNISGVNSLTANIVTANYFSGDGSNLSNVSGTSITGQVANALVAGTVYTNAQPNITSVGTLTSLQVSGDITPATDAVYNLGNATNSFKSLYLSGNTIYIGGQTISSNTTAVTISGDASLGNLVTANYANFANDIQLYGNIQTGNGAGGNISGVDNITANYFKGDGSNLSAIAGANVSGTVSSATTAGTVTTAAQGNITSLGTLTSLNASGQINSQGNQDVGTLLTATGSLGGTMIQGAGGANAAFMSFHRPSVYASYFGIDTDNNFAVGGWSAGAALASMKVGSFGVGTAASGTAGEIRATDNITAYYSDKRLKKDITAIPNALEKVTSISGVYYRSNEEAAKYGYDSDKLQVGVIAQEIAAVLPEVVVPAPFDIAQNEDGTEYSKSGENYKTVHYDKLVPLLIEAIKELKAEVDELRARVK